MAVDIPYLERNFRTLVLTGDSLNLYIRGLSCDHLKMEKGGLTEIATNPAFPAGLQGTALKVLPSLNKALIVKGGCSSMKTNTKFLLGGAGLIAVWFLFIKK